MPSAQVWRIIFYPRLGGGAYRSAFAEIQMRTTPGGANAAVGGTPSATFPEGSYPVANAFDGSAATLHAQSSGSPGYWGVSYDFGGPIGITEMAITFGAGGSTYPGSVYAPELIRPEYLDGATWKVAGPAIVAPGGYADGSTQILTIADLGGTMPAGGDAAIYAALSPLAYLPQPASGQPDAIVTPARVIADVEDGGTLRIAGTVDIDDTPIRPARRRVRLFHQASGRIVRETWSDAVTGAYAFEQLADDEYFVLVHDHLRDYDPTARDYRRPVQ